MHFRPVTGPLISRLSQDKEMTVIDITHSSAALRQAPLAGIDINFGPTHAADLPRAGGTEDQQL
jgi:hypothetical protein